VIYFFLMSLVNWKLSCVDLISLCYCSGRDQWLMNKEDIERLRGALPRCEVRELENNGQFLFLVRSPFS